LRSVAIESSQSGVQPDLFGEHEAHEAAQRVAAVTFDALINAVDVADKYRDADTQWSCIAMSSGLVAAGDAISDIATLSMPVFFSRNLASPGSLVVCGRSALQCTRRDRRIASLQQRVGELIAGNWANPKTWSTVLLVVTTWCSNRRATTQHA